MVGAARRCIDAAIVGTRKTSATETSQELRALYGNGDGEKLINSVGSTGTCRRHGQELETNVSPRPRTEEDIFVEN